MSNEKKYWVVEFRFPINISNADSPERAASIAADKMNEEYGFRPSAWYTRVFEYGPSLDIVGPLAEYFCNPAGTQFRQLNKNDEAHSRLYHEKVVEKDINNEDIN